MPHDFVKFPELRTSQFDNYYFQSPHKQIVENFRARVMKVHDGDTVTLRVDFRDFDFPLRFIGTNAPELNEDRGNRSKYWLEAQILDKMVDIIMNSKNRVGKFGRLIGAVFANGMNINEQSIREGYATSFENRNEGKLPIINKELRLSKWL